MPLSHSPERREDDTDEPPGSVPEDPVITASHLTPRAAHEVALALARAAMGVVLARREDEASR